MLQIVCFSHYSFTLVLCFEINAFNWVMQTPWAFFSIWPTTDQSELFPQGYFRRTWGSRFSNPASSLQAEVPGDAIYLTRKSWPFKPQYFSEDDPLQISWTYQISLSFDFSKINSNKTHMSQIMN